MNALHYKSISGLVKNKVETMRRLIDAVGVIIKEKGYKGLGINTIAKEADVSKVLIYRYFGSLDQLVEAYVLKNDYWIANGNEIAANSEGKIDKEGLKEIIKKLLRGHFEYFNTHDEMRSIILWEITEQTNLLNSICQVRETIGNVLVEKSAPLFATSNKNLKAITAILVSGIYYMILHSKKNESTICGVDVNSEEGEAEILNAIDQIIEWTFEE